MSSQLNPYITFNGNAREAMEFYQSVFGGKLDILTYDSMPMGATDAEKDQVMHSYLHTDEGYSLMATDLLPSMGMPYIAPSAGMTLTISGDDEALLRGYWEKISAGGSIGMPLEKQIWGDIYGDLTDRFGIKWAFNIGAPI